MMKIKKRRVFLRTVRISTLVIFCLCLGFFGMVKAYENTRRIGFGEYRDAIEIEDGKIKIFDLEFQLTK